MNKGSPVKLDHRVVESSRKSYVNKDKCIEEIVRLAELNNKLIIQVDYWKNKYLEEHSSKKNNNGEEKLPKKAEQLIID